MNKLFLALLNTFNYLGKITNAYMSERISTVDLKLDGKKYVLSIRLEEEEKDA